MEIKDIEDVKEELKGITLVQMRDPQFSSRMTELYVLVGDLVTMVRRPINTFPLLKSEIKNKLATRGKNFPRYANEVDQV